MQRPSLVAQSSVRNAGIEATNAVMNLFPASISCYCRIWHGVWKLTNDKNTVCRYGTTATSTCSTLSWLIPLMIGADNTETRLWVYKTTIVNVGGQMCCERTFNGQRGSRSDNLLLKFIPLFSHSSLVPWQRNPRSIALSMNHLDEPNAKVGLFMVLLVTVTDADIGAL